MVYLCHDEIFDRPVAIKTPRYDSVEQLTNSFESFVQGAKRWILAGREMEIVEAYTLFTVPTDDGLKVPYLAVEFIKGDARNGSSLRGWIHDSRLDLQLTLYFAHTICSGMIKLQEKLGRPGSDFVHLNLKPQNILVSHEGTLKITNIGLTEISYKMALQGRLISPPFKNQDDLQVSLPPRVSSEPRHTCLLNSVWGTGQLTEDPTFIHSAASCTKCVQRSPASLTSLKNLSPNASQKKPEERPADFGEVREEIHKIVKTEGIPPGIPVLGVRVFCLYGNPRVKSDMNMKKEEEAVFLAKTCGAKYVIDQGLVKDREELEALLAKDKQLAKRESRLKKRIWLKMKGSRSERTGQRG